MKLKTKQRGILLLLGIFLAVILVYNTNSTDKTFVPDEMAGRWTADSPKYKGCYLELSSVAVLYGTREDTVSVNFVQSIEKRVEGNQSLYTIHYKNRSGEKGNISLFWNSINNKIRLKNQHRMTWSKVTRSS